jgi:hypothetical protein
MKSGEGGEGSFMALALLFLAKPGETRGPHGKMRIFPFACIGLIAFPEDQLGDRNGAQNENHIHS